MNESRKAGRPRKHLQDDHHFKPAEPIELETSDDVATAGAPPVAAEADQGDGFDSLVESNPAPVIHEAVVEASVALPIEPLVDISPVEEKIQQIIEGVREGWHTLDTDIILKQPPRNGMPIHLAPSLQGTGVLGFWKRTRAFNGKRYEETGKWVNFNSGMDIPFKPIYWKERF